MKIPPGSALLALVLLVSPACIADGAGTAGLLVGLRDLNEDDWAPVDEQTAVTVDMSYVSRDNGWGFEASAGRGADEANVGGFDVESTTDELAFGVRKEFGLGEGVRLKPYVGAGGAFLQAEAEVGPASADDDTFGAYAHGGVRLDVTEALYVGFDVRGMFGTSVEFGGFEGDVDYVQYGITVGVNF